MKNFFKFENELLFIHSLVKLLLILIFAMPPLLSKAQVGCGTQNLSEQMKSSEMKRLSLITATQQGSFMNNIPVNFIIVKDANGNLPGTYVNDFSDYKLDVWLYEVNGVYNKFTYCRNPFRVFILTFGNLACVTYRKICINLHVLRILHSNFF